MSETNMRKLGVNLDHIAAVREARKTIEPDPVQAVLLAELAGADGITIHLREDRRHIQDRDLRLIRKVVKTRLNMEMAAVDEMITIAHEIRPDQATLVPEKRKEVTTEGGLDLISNFRDIKDAVGRLQEESIPVSLFIDPVDEQINAAKETGATFIEINTAGYAETKDETALFSELSVISKAVDLASHLGLRVNAGHGLTYSNISFIAELSSIEEFNIGHSIISRAVFTGLTEAVREMKRLIT